MCYHGSKNFNATDLEAYYSITLEDEMKNNWSNVYHENGFDHLASPVVLPETQVGLFTWGLIPWFTKSTQDAMIIRNRTLNCISEEMFDKPSFRDALKNNQRCLIPMTGFFEWKWQDSKGKEKTPHYIYLKNQKIFSVAGVYSTWKDKSTDTTVHSYSVLTTQANKLMAEIHNSMKRMPVIIPREYEGDWLNPNLTKADVLALCVPYDDSNMEAHQISKLITSKRDLSNVPAVLEKVESDRLF